jgi:competence protein ComEA
MPAMPATEYQTRLSGAARPGIPQPAELNEPGGAGPYSDRADGGAAGIFAQTRILGQAGIPGQTGILGQTRIPGQAPIFGQPESGRRFERAERAGGLQRLLGRIHDRLPPTLQGRWRIDRRAAAVLTTAVCIAAIGLTAWTMLRSSPHQVELPIGGGRPVAASSSWPDTRDVRDAGDEGDAAKDLVSSGASGAPGGSRAAATNPDGRPGQPGASGMAGAGSGIVIDVEGKVATPGVVRLPAGSRVLDALHAAGGALPGMDLSALNQARVLDDGEQVFVAAPGQAPPNPGPVASAPASKGSKSRGKQPLTAPIHLNTATLDQLEQLPGVGPALAQRILDWRSAHGEFASVGQLHQVKGFGPAKFGALSGMVLP